MAITNLERLRIELANNGKLLPLRTRQRREKIAVVAGAPGNLKKLLKASGRRVGNPASRTDLLPAPRHRSEGHAHTTHGFFLAADRFFFGAASSAALRI